MMGLPDKSGQTTGKRATRTCIAGLITLTPVTVQTSVFFLNVLDCLSPSKWHDCGLGLLKMNDPQGVEGVSRKSENQSNFGG